MNIDLASNYLNAGSQPLPADQSQGWSLISVCKWEWVFTMLIIQLQMKSGSATKFAWGIKSRGKYLVIR